MTRKKMYDTLLISFAVVVGICGIGTVFVTMLKNADINKLRREEHDKVQAAISQSDSLNQLHDLEMKAANAKVQSAQAEMREAQTAYDLLNEQRKNEILLHQKEMGLLNEKLIAENSNKVIGSMRGEKSKPVLKLSNHSVRSSQHGVLYWDNHEGEDAAYVVSGSLFPGDKNYGTVSFGATTIPARTVMNTGKISFQMIDENDDLIGISFTTHAGAFHETLYFTYDGQQYRQAFEVTDYNNKEVRRHIDDGFPLDSSKFGPLLKIWLKKK